MTGHTLTCQGHTEADVLAKLALAAEKFYAQGLLPVGKPVIWQNNRSVYAAQRYGAPLRAMLAMVQTLRA